jgi:type IV pilus assembly protein PilE
MMIRRGRASGFTLIEVVIVMAIIAILTSIAVPAYTQHIRTSNRAAAKTALSDILSRQESFRSDRNSYATTLAAVGVPVDGSDITYVRRDGQVQTTAADAVYRIVISGASATAFTLQAVPIAAQASDGCGTLSVTNNGAKTVTGSYGVDKCWKR